MHDVLPLLRPLFSVCMRSHSYVRPFDIQTMEPTLSFTCAVNHRNYHIKALPGMYSYKHSSIESLALGTGGLVAPSLELAIVGLWFDDGLLADEIVCLGFQICPPPCMAIEMRCSSECMKSIVALKKILFELGAIQKFQYSTNAVKPYVVHMLLLYVLADS